MFRSGGGDSAQVNEAVAARLDRQSILDEPGRRIGILTTEGALGWGGGPPGMMARQLERIAELAARPDLWIGVIPFGTPAEVFPVSTWTLYDERAAVPGVLSAQVVLNGARVRPYVEQWDRLEPLAVVGEKALPLLDDLAARYRRMR